MHLSFKYRLEPTKAQAASLCEMLAGFCSLYNAALEQRIAAWRRRKISLTYAKQALELKALRTECPEYASWSFSAQQQLLRRVDKAFRKFFAGFGYPRFKPTSRFHAVDFRFGDGLRIMHQRLSILGVTGAVKVRWHRDLPASPVAAVITRQSGKWYVVFYVETKANARNVDARTVGIDVGLSRLCALSDGQIIPRPRWSKRAAKAIRRRQRAVARCKKGSKSRAKRVTLLARTLQRVASRRRDYLHKVSAVITSRFTRIAVEDLAIASLARSCMSREIADVSWAQLISMLTYKASRAGGEVIKVDPRGTSQTCPECGAIDRKDLGERVHSCSCGAQMDRDVASAIVIHMRAFGLRPGAGHDRVSQPVTA